MEFPESAFLVPSERAAIHRAQRGEGREQRDVPGCTCARSAPTHRASGGHREARRGVSQYTVWGGDAAARNFFGIYTVELLVRNLKLGFGFGVWGFGLERASEPYY